MKLDGFTFDSQREATRWGVLKAERERGLICGLQVGRRFVLRINGVIVGRYKADFVYVRNGTFVIEDVKSKFTANLKEWKFKRKVIEACLRMPVTVVVL